MFGSKLLFRTRCFSRIATHKASWAFRPMAIRSFSTNIRGTEGESETIIDDHNYYSPTKTIDISSGSFTVFDNKEIGAGLLVSPYEVKETITKNSIGAIFSVIIENCLISMSYIPTTFFAINMFYQVASYMTRAVDQMVLLKWGTKVEVSFKIGGSQTWEIKDVRKKIDEKALVETFAEPYLFPITVRGKGTYYLYGHGHGAIKDGELFRAIINGKSISFD